MAIITPSDQPLGQAAGGLYDLITNSLQKIANTHLMRFIQMRNNLDKLLSLIANSLGRSELLICQLVIESLSARYILKQTKNQIIPLKFNHIDPPRLNAHRDLYQAIFQSSADLSWRSPGFGKIPVEISNHMAVCEIIGPTGHIKHETVRTGLLFQASVSPTHATVTLRRKYIFL